MGIAASFFATAVATPHVTQAPAAARVLQVTRDSAVREVHNSLVMSFKLLKIRLLRLCFLFQSVSRADSGLIVFRPVTATETRHVTLSAAGVCVHRGRWGLDVI